MHPSISTDQPTIRSSLLPISSSTTGILDAMRELAFAVACGLALILLILPAPWHIKTRNSGTLLYIGWAFLGNLIYLVNAIVWNGNITDPAPVWCDISSKLIIGLNIALPCVSLCIQRRLYNISKVSQVSPTHEQRRREIYIDLSIGLGLPILVMILHYIVQGHRYDVYEDYGCIPSIYLSWPAYVLVLSWPIIISCASIVFAGLTFRNFLRRRATFNELLRTQGSVLNVNRYVRLMALASVELLFVFPISLVVLVYNASLPLQPWISWENTHYNFGRVSFFTNFLIRSSTSTYTLLRLTRWCMPATGLLFFVFFGLASEATKQYKKTFNAILQVLGIRPATLPYSDRKDTPLTAATARSGRTGLVHHENGSTVPMTTPLDKKRPDTFAWMDEDLPYDDTHYSMPQAPSLAYDAKNRRSHTPCTPSTSTSYSSTDGTSTIGRQDSISSSRSGKTMRDSQDDDATICGVPTSLKRADSIDKPLPEIPFQDFRDFRQSQIAARRSAADVDLEAQVQIIVSSPTNTEFDREDEEQTDVDHSTPVMPTRSLAPPAEVRPLSTASSMLSEGGETVFFTPSPGRLSLFPMDFEVTAGATHPIPVNEGERPVQPTAPSDLPPTL